MAKIIGTPILVMVNGGGGSSVDNFSTLPPPVANLTAEAGDATVTLSFEAVPEEYQQYLSNETAYIVVLKQGSIPESPTDGYVVKLNKDGLVVTEGGAPNPVEPVFPVEPSTYTLIDTYTADTTFTAPEDGWFQIELFGASGNGGAEAIDTYQYLIDTDGDDIGDVTCHNVCIASGGGAGSGGYAMSQVALNKGDTIVLADIAIGSTATVDVQSTRDTTYSHTMQCTSGTSGSNGTAKATSNTSTATRVAGSAGAGGVASGGLTKNISGNAGGVGNALFLASYPNAQNPQYTNEATGGVAVVDGGTVGGAGGRAKCTWSYAALTVYRANGSQYTAAGSGQSAFMRIYRGDTNITA